MDNRVAWGKDMDDIALFNAFPILSPSSKLKRYLKEAFSGMLPGRFWLYSAWGYLAFHWPGSSAWSNFQIRAGGLRTFNTKKNNGIKEKCQYGAGNPAGRISALTFGLTGIIMLLFTQYCAFTAQYVRK